MGVIVGWKGKKAILRRGEWRSSDAALESMLNRATDQWIAETGGPALTSHDPEREVAHAIAKLTGGRVLLRAKTDRRREARDYLSRRQLSLPFAD
ncbi:MAG: hypothetical protein KJZ84_04390 [Bryobacteraceae bacterium]|nr:hypothetical protein [Bryobacteraceae bacterium]